VSAVARLVTVGHGTATQERLLRLLSSGGVHLVVDIRRFPGSRRHPHVAANQLEHWLPDAGIAYRWEPRLGGRRRVPFQEPSADAWWQVEAFRAYAAHARTDGFRAAMADLLADEAATTSDTVIALMCSESLWWRCHRRIIADVAVLLHRLPVQHLGHDGILTTHVPAAGARISPDGLRYDDAQ
jgi:uncharacterized protein (DUF488 family)